MIQHWVSSEPVTPDEAHNLRSIFWRTLAAIVLLRAIFIATVPIDLSGDEAYYWDWGRRLALGYYSKPPAIAWIMAAAGWIGNDTVFGIRMVANVMTAGSAVFVFLLADALYGARAALLAGLAFCLTPATAALAFLMTIDAPLVLCWSAALYLSWRMLTDPEKSVWRTAALVLAIAFGMLSKQMMMLFPLLLLLFAALHPPARPHLRRPRFWSVILFPYLALAAPLWWNYRHDWITFRHTSGHFDTSLISPGAIARRVLAFAGGEAALVTPVGYVLILAVGIAGLIAWRRLGGAERFLLLFGAPALIVTHLMTIRQDMNLNWPAVFYVSTLVLLAGWAVHVWDTGTRIETLRRLSAPGLALAAGMTLATYLGAYAVAFGWLSLGDLNPLRRAQGWSAAAQGVQAFRAPYPEDVLLVVGHRWVASELAFYLPDRPRVYLHGSGEFGEIRSQYDVWPDLSTQLGENAIIVLDANRTNLSPDLARCFENAERLGLVESPSGYRRLTRLQVYRGLSLKSYPPSPSKEIS